MSHNLKILQRWIHISRLMELYPNESNNDVLLMLYLAEWSKKAYTCLRPPGAAGAMLQARDDFVFCGVAPPIGSPTCKEVGSCEMENGHCVRTIHAERAVLYNAAKFGIVTYNATMFSVLKPCYECSKALIAAGISTIFYAAAAYDEERTRQMLFNANVTIQKIDIKLDYGF
jgi:deoxycytidylate deaminase